MLFTTARIPSLRFFAKPRSGLCVRNLTLNQSDEWKLPCLHYSLRLFIGLPLRLVSGLDIIFFSK